MHINSSRWSSLNFFHNSYSTTIVPEVTFFLKIVLTACHSLGCCDKGGFCSRDFGWIMVDHHSHPWRDFRRVHGVAATAVPRVNPFPLCWRRGSAVGYTTPLAERMKKIRQAYNVMSLSPGEKQHKCTLRVANTCERKVSKNHAMFVMPFWIFVAPQKMLSTRSAHYTTWYGFFSSPTRTY